MAHPHFFRSAQSADVGGVDDVRPGLNDVRGMDTQPSLLALFSIVRELRSRFGNAALGPRSDRSLFSIPKSDRLIIARDGTFLCRLLYRADCDNALTIPRE